MWSKESFLLAMIGGVGYCLTAYTAFHYAPAAHAAVFLNGCIPLCTAVAAFVLFKQGFDRHTWISMAIMLLAIGSMSWLMFRESGVALGLGDLLFFISAMWWGCLLYCYVNGNSLPGILWPVWRSGQPSFMCQFI